jgi:CRP-like cAMP-binding protein
MVAVADPMRVFGAVRAPDVRSLAGPVVDIEIPAGAQLVREGHVIGTFFVIRSGSAELRRGDRRVRTLGTGDCFGEIDPAAIEPQAYSVVATSPMRLLTFSALGIARLCATIPATRERIVDHLPRETDERRVAPEPHHHARRDPHRGFAFTR